MNYTRMYTGPDGESHLEEVAVPLPNPGLGGHMSDPVPVTGIQFRLTGPSYENDFHHAPRRQFVIQAQGAMEIETGDGARQQLEPGEVLLAEDTSGRGHITRATDEQPRLSIFITLD